MKQKLIASAIAAAFAGTAGVAMAGPISVASIGTYASETIGQASGTIGVGNVAYTLSNPWAIGSTVVVRYVLSSKLATCPTLAFQYQGAPVPPDPGLTTNPPAVGSDGVTCSWTATVGSGAGNAVPANTVLNFTKTAADKTAGAVLAGGGTLSATVSVIDSFGSTVESNSAVVATAGEALSAKWTSSGMSTGTAGLFPTGSTETSKVDVTTTPVVGSGFTNPTDATNSTTTIVLGAFSLANNTGTYLDSNGVTGTNVNIASLTTNKWNLTVTGPFVTNSKTPTSNVIFLSTASNCSTPLGSSSFTLSGTTATLTGFNAIAAALPTTSPQSVFVCYAPQTGLTTPVAIPTGPFSGSATTVAATAVTPTGMIGETATGSLYNLSSNGAQVDVRVVTTSGTSGWTTVLRIINTGGIAAPVTATYLNADGTFGATGPIISSLAPNATAMISSAQIEQALGISLPSTGNPPRIRISAPTDSLRVQAWVNANGQWFMGSPSQGAEAVGTQSTAGALDPK